MKNALFCIGVIAGCCTVINAAELPWPMDQARANQLHQQDVIDNPAYAHNKLVHVNHTGGTGFMSFPDFLNDLGNHDSTTYLIEKSSSPYVVGCQTIYIGGWSKASLRRSIAVRGATGVREDVVLVGADPAVDPNFWKSSEYGGSSSCGAGKVFQIVNADNVLFADLTMRNFAGKMIAVDGGLDNGQPYYSRHVVLHNLDLWDCGSQLIKGGGPPISSKDCILECSKIRYTDGLFVESNYQTQGIDIHRGRNWIVRDNYFLNCRMHAGTGSWGTGILFWDHSDSTLIERNIIQNCDFAMVLGMGNTDSTDYVTARNNIIIYDDNSGNWKPDDIIATKTPFTIHGGIYHNTIYNPYPTGIAFVVCQSALPVANNVYMNGYTGRCGSQQNNLVATASWFVNGTGFDFHPAANHTVPQVPDVGEDILGHPRANPPTAGAFEYGTFSTRVRPATDGNSVVSILSSHAPSKTMAIYNLQGKQINPFAMRNISRGSGKLLLTKVNENGTIKLIPILSINK